MEESTPIPPVAVPSATDMPDQPDAPTVTEDAAMLPLSKLTPILRVLSGIILSLGAGYCAFCAVMLAIGTIIQVPNFLYYSLSDPFTPLLGTVAYLGTILICTAVCLTGFYVAYHLIRGNDLARGTLLGGIILIVIMLGCQYFVMPVFAAPFIS